MFIKYLKNFFLIVVSILIITLNVFDIFNFLNSDIDFLKKIISLVLISYLFYKISTTQIFFGLKNKIYDLIFIIIFLILILPKLLFKYILFVDINSFIFFDGTIKLFLKSIIYFEPYKIVDILFLVGLIIYSFFFLFLINNLEIQKKGLFSSFNFKDNFFSFILKMITYYFSILFFGILIFNFFVEWFAFAIDYFILFLGLIFLGVSFFYNLFKKKNAQNRFTNLIYNITNFGSDIYVKSVEHLSSKKTFFYTILIIFTAHLFVDFIVFIFSYSIGFLNSFYFGDLNLGSQNQLPLIDFFNFENSNFYKDLSLNPSLLFFILFMYLSYIFYFSIILIFPMYIIFKKIKGEEIILKFNFVLFFITFTFFYLMNFLLKFFLNFSLFENIFSLKILSSDVLGIFFETSMLFTYKISFAYFFIIFFILLLIFLTSIFLVKIYFEKFSKITIFLCEFFLIFYITIFGYSVINEQKELIEIKTNKLLDRNFIENSNSNFSKIINGLDSENNFFSQKKFFSKDKKISFSFFSDLDKNFSNALNHNDYILIEVEDSQRVVFKYRQGSCKSNIFDCSFYASNNFSYNKYLNLISFENSKILISMKNKFRVENTISLDDLNVDIVFNEKIINSLFLVKRFNFNDIMSSFYFIQNIILFVFNLFFYLGGLIYLFYFYVRK